MHVGDMHTCTHVHALTLKAETEDADARRSLSQLISRTGHFLKLQTDGRTDVKENNKGGGRRRRRKKTLIG